MNSKVHRIILIGIAILVAAVGVSADDFNLDSLLIESVGGPGAVDTLAGVRTIYGAGSITLNGMPGRFELYTALPDRIYFEVSVGPLSMTQAWDGEVAWTRDPNGMVSILSGYEKLSLLSMAFFQTYSHLFEGRMQGGHEYLGLEERGGDTLHKVAFYPLNQDTVVSYFDPSTARQRYDVTYLDNAEAVTEYLNFREYRGVMVSYESHGSLPAAQATVQMRVDSLVFNADFDPAIFYRPVTLDDFVFPENTDSVIVPFEMEAGHIYVEAELNGLRLLFLLDSGASKNIFHSAAIEDLNLETAGEVSAKGVAGYEKVKLVKTDSLRIGRLVLYEQVGGTMPLDLLAERHDAEPPFGGVLGYDLLSRFPTQVDYADRQLIFYNPADFVMPDSGSLVPFELTMQIPTIEAELIGIKGRFLVDLGNALGLILHREFVRANDLESRLDDIREVSGVVGGIGGGAAGKTAYAAWFGFGDVRISDLRVLMPDGTAGLTGSVELAGNIGNLVLEQFRVLFDYRGQQLLFMRSGDDNAAKDEVSPESE